MENKEGCGCSLILSALIIFAGLVVACIYGRWWLPDFFEMLSSFAWPALILFIFWTLRKPIENLIKRIKRIKHNGTEIDIHEELDFVEETIQENKETLTSSPNQSILQETNVLNDNNSEQSNSIFETLWNLSHKQHKDMTSDFILKWIEFEKFIRDFAEGKDFQINNVAKDTKNSVIYAKTAPFGLILRFLLLMEYLSSNDVEAIKSLSKIRNSIVHEGITSVNRDDLNRYLRNLDDMYKIVQQKLQS